MVDYVPKVGSSPYRVDEPKEALDDEGKKGGQEGEAEEEGDNFNKLTDKTDWKGLFDKSDLWRQNVEVKVEDVDRIKFLGLNLNTNPALLKIRLFLFDGTVINTAFMSVSRTQAMQLKNYNRSAHVDVNALTKEASLWLSIPKDESAVDDEITNISRNPMETTFSHTFKKLVSKKSWMERLNIQDPVSKRVKDEIFWVYVTIVTVLSVVCFGVFYMLF